MLALTLRKLDELQLEWAWEPFATMIQLERHHLQAADGVGLKDHDAV